MTFKSRMMGLFGAALMLAGLQFGSTIAIADDLAFKPVEGAFPVPLEGQAGLTSREDLEAFMDGVMADQLAVLGIPGAVVSVVKDGEIFFAKGYGHANREQNVPMDGVNSLVRPGSVSKLFTWTAVMQLVEQGKIDLDADVNTYLTSFKIPEKFGLPITMRNVLTHTAGLEDGALGYLIVGDEGDLVPLSESLVAHMPERVRPPTTDFTDGRNASYSNWATALAGVIVEDITGVGFNDYVEANILKPLGMNDSTFAEPLPADLAENFATGYSHMNGEFNPETFEFIGNFGPAGSLTASAPDMAKFMIAFLQGGSYQGNAILKPETVALMHSRVFSPSPYVNGSGLGFYETYINGRRVLGHGGDTAYFHSLLALVEGQDVGLFISYTSDPKLPVSGREHVMRAFMDRYFPAALPKIDVPFAGNADKIADYVGDYRYLRQSFTKNEKLFAAFGGMSVVPLENGNLLATGLMGAPETQLISIAPDTFRKTDSDMVISFMRDENGVVTGMTLPLAFIAAYKLAWYETTNFNASIVVLALLVSILAIVAAIRNRKDQSKPAKRARLVAAASGIVVVGSIGTLVVSIMIMMQDPIAGFPPLMDAALYGNLASVGFGLLFAAFAVLAWLRGWFGIWARLRYTASAAIILAYLWALNFWNLIGFHYG